MSAATGTANQAWRLLGQRNDLAVMYGKLRNRPTSRPKDFPDFRAGPTHNPAFRQLHAVVRRSDRPKVRHVEFKFVVLHEIGHCERLTSYFDGLGRAAGQQIR